MSFSSPRAFTCTNRRSAILSSSFLSPKSFQPVYPHSNFLAHSVRYFRIRRLLGRVRIPIIPHSNSPAFSASYLRIRRLLERIGISQLILAMLDSLNSDDSKPNAKRQKISKPKKEVKEGSNEEILQHDINSMLTPANANTNANELEDQEREKELPPLFDMVELTISKLSSTGDGLAYSKNKDHVYVVPFSLPGDIVEAKVYKHFETHSLTDFIRVITPSLKRDDSLVRCKYFASCAGCQFQMLPYDVQLLHKQDVIEKAYENFSGLDSAVIPEIGPTWASPLEYGYRTKLTPHFNRPGKKGWEKTPPIGFQKKGTRQVIDVEDCPIATPIIREGLREQRQWVKGNLLKFKKGATLLLRESTTRIPKDNGVDDAAGPEFIEGKKCVTVHKEEITEYIGKYKLTSPAGTFFQNNNSILDEFTGFVRDNLHLPFPVYNYPVDKADAEIVTATSRYLVDAYCGSGLFTITCGEGFDGVVGVDIAEQSVEYARKNAAENQRNNTNFIVGQAEKIFEGIKFPGSETAVIIDPPRKGCDESFLDQLLSFGPRRIIYVSCNVHTQARDIGYLLRHDKGVGYKIVSIRGFDFFPQTHHVESLAILMKVI